MKLPLGEFTRLAVERQAGSDFWAIGPAALAFIGAGSKDDLIEARRLIADHGDGWRIEWLRRRGLEEWADYLAKLYTPRWQTLPESPIYANGVHHEVS